MFTFSRPGAGLSPASRLCWWGVCPHFHFLGPLSGPGTSQPVAVPLEPDHRRAPTSRGQQPPARSRPSSTEEGPLTPANFGRKCLEFRFRFREWTVIFFFFFFLSFTSKPTFISTSARTVRWQLSRIKPSLRPWPLRLKSHRPLRSPRRPNLRPPERKMTLSWGNLAELWREGKRRKKVIQLARQRAKNLYEQLPDSLTSSFLKVNTKWLSFNDIFTP